MSHHTPGPAERPDREPPVLLGPAVPTRLQPAAPEPGSLDEPLMPFVSGTRGSAAEPVPAVEPVPEPVPVADLAPDAPPVEEVEADDDLPWLLPTEPEAHGEDDLGLVRGVEWGFDLGDDGPAGLEPLGDPDASGGAGADLRAPWLEENWDPPAPAHAGEDDGTAQHSIAPPTAEAAMPGAERGTAADTRAGQLEEGVATAARGAADQLADRLEAMARAIRGRSPLEILATAEDPLEMLIAGYLLGRAEASRSAGGDRPEP